MMLPYYKIIDDKMTTEPPSKPKRATSSHNSRKQIVPVHKHQANNDHRQNFSANFPAGDFEQKPATANLETTERRVSRRYLVRELEKLRVEKVDLLNAQEHLTRKNAKLKEKCTQIFNAHEEISNENVALKAQYQELLDLYTSIKKQLEQPKVCQDCIEMADDMEKIRADYGSLRKSNQECLEDCDMLKNVVYRLNVQLERYQQKLQTHNISLKDASGSKMKNQRDYEDPNQLTSAENLGESHLGHNHSPVSWGRVNTHTLAPLLNAYQEIIAEKEEIIENYETEMANFTSKLKTIMRENEEMHLALNQDTECSKVLAVQLENCKAELKCTKDQNDLLIKKCALKQDKIEEILQCYEQKVDSLKRDYAVLHETYSKAKVDVMGLKEKNKSLLESYDEFKNERQQYIPLAVHTSSVSECKKWYEELKQQYEVEKSKLEDTIIELKKQCQDFNDKIASLNLEKQELENKLKNCDKHLKKTEAKYLDLEHNLREVQLSRSACRKQLHKAMNFAKDLVNEQESLLKALNQRQLENKAVKRLGTDIASRMDLLRNQLKSVQKEAWQELSTVEERIQEQDSIIMSMKEEHEQEIERLKNIIKDKQEM